MKNGSYVILSVARGHNGSATLMVDGQIVWYLEEERLSRRKYDGSPLMAMQKAMDFVDHIDELIVCHTHRHSPNLDWTCEDMYQGWLRKISRSKFQTKITFIDTIHHQMHATTAFINSGFETAACVVADGAGSFLKTTEEICPSTVFEFETILKASYPLDFEVIYKHYGTDYPVGLRMVSEGGEEGELVLTEYPGFTKTYESVSEYCGFQSIDAGKTMGLSPYGKPNDLIPPIIREGWGNRDMFVPNYPNNSTVNVWKYPQLAEDMKNHEKGKYTEIQKDMAYAVQKETEEAMIKLIRKAHEMTGETNICISGGYGLNCVANYKYWKEFPDLNIYCEPISHDGGTSMGGAYYALDAFTKLTKPPLKKQRDKIYYGPDYNPEYYLAPFAQNNDLYFDYEITDTSYSDVAHLIREGKIVTIFQGRSEGGPRALGNRSILFDPSIKDGKDIVNGVKKREFFRPFACSILAEKVHDWFDLVGRDDSPNMMYAVECLPGVEEKIPSVIHVDGTCRIQTVTQEQNYHYYNLISAFEEISEIPILFNTSFNLGGQPLVESPIDAIETIVHSELEYIYYPEIQKLLYISNEKNKEIVQAGCPWFTGPGPEPTTV